MSICVSSMHTRSLCKRFCIHILVLHTEVKLGMVQFKVFFFHTKYRFPWAWKTDLFTFVSSGVSLLSGQWFLPVYLVMLSIVQLVSESLEVTQDLLCPAYNLLELALHLQGPVYPVHNFLEIVLHLQDPNIFWILFILSMTCWGFPKTHLFIRYPSCSSFIYYWRWYFNSSCWISL